MIENLGAASTAYFGGRSESRIRLVPLPVRYIDFTSMYPTVFALGDLWHWVIAGGFGIEDAIVAVERFLATVHRDRLADPAIWPAMAMVFCRVRPDGALLPTRSRYSDDRGAWTIGINHLHSTTELWFTLADVVSALLLGGPAPSVVEAFRIVPTGVLDGLRSVDLRGGVHVDPTDNLLRVAIEERQRVKRAGGDDVERLSAFLKTFANGGYGIFAEYRLGEPRARGVAATAHGLWPIDTRVRTPEEPGEFSFPPLAATITGLARLLLSIAQVDVEARGGTFLACDTDSLLVVASPTGGMAACPGGPLRLEDSRAAICVLSDAELDDVLAGIETLNPYAPGTVIELVKLEGENFASDGSGRRVELRGLAISPKRYVLYELGSDGPIIRKPSSHGLGMYRPPMANPRGWDNRWPYWIEIVWDAIIRQAEGLEVDPEPPWYGLPAVSQLSITSPRLLAPFRTINTDKRFKDQVKPFGFMLIGHVDPFAPLPDGLELGQLTPIAPYSTKPEEFLDLPWVNRHDGRPLRVTTAVGGAMGSIRLKTYGDVVAEYRVHPDAKSGDPRGGQSHRGSRGLLPRLHVRVSEVRHIGKESNRLDEEDEGAVLASDDVYVEYRDARREWAAAVPRLQLIGAIELARRTGMSARTMRSRLNSGRMPRKRDRQRLLELAAQADLPMHSGPRE
ncbi:MAG: hypothetical protein M3406_13235 [Chloroflexota bacterium]|nr:hypothetical protein [Chloroflexota bacterium]